MNRDRSLHIRRNGKAHCLTQRNRLCVQRASAAETYVVPPVVDLVAEVVVMQDPVVARNAALVQSGNKLELATDPPTLLALLWQRHLIAHHVTVASTGASADH